MRLKIMEFAETCGLFWGIGLFLLTWWIIAFDGSSDERTSIGRVYRGYRVSPLGSLIGLVWATIDGFVGGLMFAWLYNKLCGESVQSETERKAE